jgi:hypothetical protein
LYYCMANPPFQKESWSNSAALVQSSTDYAVPHLPIPHLFSYGSAWTVQTTNPACHNVNVSLFFQRPQQQLEIFGDVDRQNTRSSDLLVLLFATLISVKWRRHRPSLRGRRRGHCRPESAAARPILPTVRHSSGGGTRSWWQVGIKQPKVGVTVGSPLTLDSHFPVQVHLP